ncbi:MAG TPA: hypothetical protein VI758_12325, partial [Bacteroidota bacterium]
YYGYSFVLTNEQTLKDTVSVAVTFGIFDPCLHFTSNVTITGGGQSDVQSGEFWIAQGPGSIKQIPGSGAAIVMVRGRVNGKGWGMPYATVRLNQISSITRFEKSALFLLGRTGALLPRGNR